MKQERCLNNVRLTRTTKLLSIKEYSFRCGKRVFLSVFIGGIILFLPTNISYAQNLDSLETVLKSKKLPSKEMIKNCDDLSWGFLSDNASKSKLYARKGINEALKANDNVMTATLYRNLGVACYMISQMDSALGYFETAEKYAKKTDKSELFDMINFARGNLYNMTGNYQNAISMYLKVLPNYEKRNDKAKVRKVLGNLGTLYFSMHNYKLSEKYYLMSEKISKEIGDDWGLGQAYNGLANVYSTGIVDLEKSFNYASKALVVTKRSGDKQNEALINQSLSQIYWQHYKNFEKAIQVGLNGLNIAKEYCSPSDIAGMQNNLSNIYFHKGDYVNCRKYALEAEKTDTADLDVYSNIAANVVRSGIYLNDKENAISYFDKYFNIVENRSKKELHQYEADSEEKYQTEKKELQIANMQKQAKLMTIIGIAGALLLVLFIILIYFRYKIIKRNKLIAEQKVVQLEQEKQLVATQAILDGETAERTRLARDLHDGLGGMLSAVKLNLFDMKKDVIIETDDVSRFNKVLEMLDNSIQELRRVAHNMMPESLSRYGLKIALEDFCNSFSNVKFHFFGEENRIEKTLETTIYRAVHELVNNAVKHSQAEAINVQLILQKDVISVNVQDDGKGFDAQKDYAGNGLQNIQNRVNSVGGTMNIFSSPDKGTEISIDINITHENGKD